MPKIYLLKDSGNINNGFYVNNKYLDPDDDEWSTGYEVFEMEGFNSSKDIIVGMRCVC